MIKFVSDLLKVGGFLRVLCSSTNKTEGHDIAEICLKVALNTITLTLTFLKKIIQRIKVDILFIVGKTTGGRKTTEDYRRTIRRGEEKTTGL